MTPQLAALAVHDLKNELGALEGQLAALAAAPDRQQAAAAQRHCADLRRRFVAFLLLYRDQDGLQAQTADESPLAFLQGMVEGAGSTGARPVATRLGACTDAPPFWFFDTRLLRLALDSALHNARRFARSEVMVDAALAGDFLVITIDDDGPGLGPGLRSVGAENEDDGDNNGGAWATGLGTELCIAVARAHQHDGRVGWVRLGNRPQGGARFEIGLP